MQKIKRDLNHILIETAVRKALKEINSSPKRSIRNLVDLALHFSNGRFQKHFFSTAQEMLQNKKSAYYNLIEDIVSHVNHNTLTSFGINVGYNSFTKGAKIIRQTKEEEKFNTPWSLFLHMREESVIKHRQMYHSLILQGKKLGIYTYLIFASGNLNEICSLIKEHMDCAFILFVKPNDLTDEIIKKFQSINNIMISVCARKNPFSACKKLREAGILYSIYFKYSEENKNYILSGKWECLLSSLHPSFTFFFSNNKCSTQTQKEIYDFVVESRKNQELPTVLMELHQDNIYINNIISEKDCLTSFDTKGQFHHLYKMATNRSLNIFHNDLMSILKTAFILE